MLRFFGPQTSRFRRRCDVWLATTIVPTGISRQIRRPSQHIGESHRGQTRCKLLPANHLWRSGHSRIQSIGWSAFRDLCTPGTCSASARTRQPRRVRPPPSVAAAWLAGACRCRPAVPPPGGRDDCGESGEDGGRRPLGGGSTRRTPTPEAGTRQRRPIQAAVSRCVWLGQSPRLILGSVTGP